MTQPILCVEDVEKKFTVASGWGGLRRESLHGLRGVSLQVPNGASIGVVGESGCGKSTLARIMVGLERPSAGRVLFEGRDTRELDATGRRRFRRSVQMVFQDPMGSLDPRMRIHQIISEPLRNLADSSTTASRRKAVAELLEMVGLSNDAADRFPEQMSGGQRQRVAIARALASRPTVLICDEAVSALDISVQAQIIALLQELQSSFEMATVFISHDLSVVRQFASHIAVMYLGKVVEFGPTESVLATPTHPYTSALIAAVPEIGSDTNWPESCRLQGEVPSRTQPPSGCSFHPRCPRAEKICSVEQPDLAAHAGDRARVTACHFPILSGN